MTWGSLLHPLDTDAGRALVNQLPYLAKFQYEVGKAYGTCYKLMKRKRAYHRQCWINFFHVWCCILVRKISVQMYLKVVRLLTVGGEMGGIISICWLGVARLEVMLVLWLQRKLEHMPSTIHLFNLDRIQRTSLAATLSNAAVLFFFLASRLDLAPWTALARRFFEATQFRWWVVRAGWVTNSLEHAEQTICVPVSRSRFIASRECVELGDAARRDPYIEMRTNGLF